MTEFACAVKFHGCLKRVARVGAGANRFLLMIDRRGDNLLAMVVHREDHRMTIAIPAEIERALGEKASERHVTIEELVADALRWYLQIESGLGDELAAWQEVRDEALKTIEGI